MDRPEAVNPANIAAFTFPEGHEIADQPLIRIRPRGKWVALNLRDLWAYRELLYFMTWRDVKVRYKQTVLGAAWAIIQPVFAMVIFSLFFGKLAGISSDGIPYPVFAFAGLLPWIFFSNAITTSGNSIVNNAHVITKVYFPRMIVPAASVAAGVVDFVIAFAALSALMIYYGVSISVNILALPGLFALTVLLALGVGMWLAAVNVKYRDVRYALPFLIQLWMFVSPIIYSSSIVPPKWRWLFALNPLTGIIEGYRAALFGRPFDWAALAISFGITTVVLALSVFSFRRMEREFADII
jgi:lipopolysaccharide transport system permease protein